MNDRLTAYLRFLIECDIIILFVALIDLVITGRMSLTWWLPFIVAVLFTVGVFVKEKL